MGFAFNTEGVPQRDNNYDLLPAGWYLMQVVDSEIKAADSGNGQYLKLTFEVLQEGSKGRKLWARLNVRHTNPQAERIAQQELTELCGAVGLPKGFQDSVQLHGRPFIGRVKIEQPKKGSKYTDPNNVVKAFKAAGSGANTGAAAGNTPWGNGGQAGQGQQQAAQTTAAAPAAGSNGNKSAPPWQR